MLAESILIIIGLFGIVFLFLFKYIELYKEKKTCLSFLRDHLDGPTTVMGATIKFFFKDFSLRKIVAKAGITAAGIMHISLGWTKRGIEMVQSEILHLIALLKGKKLNIRKNSPSFFIKHIAKYKEELKDKREKETDL